MLQLEKDIMKELNTHSALSEGMLITLVGADSASSKTLCYEAISKLYHKGMVEIVPDKFGVSNVIRLKNDYQ